VVRLDGSVDDDDDDDAVSHEVLLLVWERGLGGVVFDFAGVVRLRVVIRDVRLFSVSDASTIVMSSFPSITTRLPVSRALKSSMSEATNSSLLIFTRLERRVGLSGFMMLLSASTRTRNFTIKLGLTGMASSLMAALLALVVRFVRID
jgi:hypothetical protein